MHSDTAGNCRILAEGIHQSNDMRLTGLNNNDLIIGPTGSGKTRGYVMPNIRIGNESLIVADTKGNLHRKLGPSLLNRGYRVLVVDFTEMTHSPNGYNPLDFVRYSASETKYCEQDILTISSALSPISFSNEPFWDQAAQLYLEALIAYCLECLPTHEHSLTFVSKLVDCIGSAPLDIMLQELEAISPASFAVKRYKQMKSNRTADKMDASIKGILTAKLNSMSFDGPSALFDHKNKIDFSSLGHEKTAVFLSVSDTDRSMDSLVNLFYTQAFQALCRSADKDYSDCRLAVPVRFIFDDFATNTIIPFFDRILSVIRSREISVSLIIQSLSQLDGLYGCSAAKTIINNCDTWLYLGGQDVETARHLATKLNKTPQTVLGMPLNQSLLFIRGQNPQIIKKSAGKKQQSKVINLTKENERISQYVQIDDSI